MSIGRSHVAGIQSGTQRLYVWGSNDFGQVGDNTRTFRSAPTFVDFPNFAPFLSYNSWVQVSAGDEHTVAIGQFGSLWSWGNNTFNQLGLENNQTSPLLFSWKQLTGPGRNLGIRSDGLLFSWGNSNTFGQLGIGNFAIRSHPTQIGTSSWTQVAASTTTSAGITVDGKLFMWGNNNQGQLGLGNRINQPAPTQVGDSSWSQISVGAQLTILAIRSDKLLFGWGPNVNGQIGDNTRFSRSSPVQIGSSSWSFVASSGGGDHVAAITDDGKLFTWGINFWGQLGDSTIVNRSSPVQVGTSSWTQVSVGNSHTTAIRLGGSLFTWGINNFGQLGSNTIVNRSSPVQVGTSSWTQVSVGNSHTTAIRLGGSLFTWGINNFGQLGSNTIVNRSSPVQVGTSSWTQVLSYGDITIGVTTAKTLFAWGRNISGGIGDGTTIDRSAPVQIHGSLGYLWSNKITPNDLTVGFTSNGFFISPHIPNVEDGAHFNSNSSLTLVSSSETNIAIHRSTPTFIANIGTAEVVAGPRQTYLMRLNA